MSIIVGLSWAAVVGVLVIIALAIFSSSKKVALNEKLADRVYKAILVCMIATVVVFAIATIIHAIKIWSA